MEKFATPMGYQLLCAGDISKSITPKYDLLINAKYADDGMQCLNPDTTLMLIDNTFKQKNCI